MAKIYQFPQGKEKKEIQAKLKKSRSVKIKKDIKKSSLSHILSMLFLGIRYFLGVTLDVLLLMVVSIISVFRYLIIPLGIFALILFYYNNEKMWNVEMTVTMALMVSSLINPEVLQDIQPFQTLFGVKSPQSEAK
ncbi:TPA: hypothetical protein SMV41_003551 [Proteus mirabilis]|jgi:hypothetical protein|uniref:Uncharacterized protein n=2 Tax=Morganellaceae TaxID=1903414 RepID=A0A220DHJ1_PRORE|nr:MULTISPECIES: hypothetical protein [Enterobacterales]MBA7799698.1 hypothetical protein [Citrobacter sp. RHBSTW-01065]HAN2841609.1 hypothetical protein [Escherichia coli O25b:H4-ST131]ARV75736.1 hypothetical protein PRE36P2_0020 [Providencia rettgeri]ASB04155.1 hypothetical protein AM403_21065 [Proteus mirabilis]ASF81001.1 hypothetical protein PM64421b_00002 [Proteus mirabilis]